MQAVSWDSTAFYRPPPQPSPRKRTPVYSKRNFHNTNYRVGMDGTIVDLNFLFEVTLGRPQAMAKMQSVRVPQKLPVILCKEEVTRLIA